MIPFNVGTAAWAEAADIEAGGLHAKGGLYVGESEGGKALHVGGDDLLITFGGAGSGKGRDIILPNVLNHPGNMLMLDPKGELAAVSMQGLWKQGKHAYIVNPYGLHTGPPWFLPSHAVNPLDILKGDSRTLPEDCKVIMEALIPLEAGKDSYWTRKARGWGQGFLMHFVRTKGGVTLPDLYESILSIHADQKRWVEISEKMKGSESFDVRAVIGEVLQKEKSAKAEFEGIMGSLTDGLDFMKGEALRTCLEGGDFSLSCLTQSAPAVNVYLVVPAEFMKLYAPFLRLLIGVSFQYKTRVAGSPPVVFLMDEAAQLGYFEVLERGYSVGRGPGVRMWAFFQSLGQIEDYYKREGTKAMISSAPFRQFFGVRDPDTADFVSRMCGVSTVFYDDPARQTQHKKQMLAALMQGGDDPAVLMGAAMEAKLAKEKSAMRRDLINADEVLRLGPDQQICFYRGMKPILARKRPYYDREDLAGRFMPNPEHPPYDKITVRSGGRAVQCAVRSGAIPDHLMEFPQHRRGLYSVVDLPGFSWRKFFGF